MVLACVKHGTLLIPNTECSECVNEYFDMIKDDEFESKMRKEWESRHKKKLGDKEG